MDLTAEEKRKIYEEEKARIEAERTSDNIKRKESVEFDEPTRTHRITASSIAIAWCLALLILFYFFRRYLAYYQIEEVNGVMTWVRYEILNSNFNVWLPVLTIVLVLSIIGHIFALILDKYLVRQSILSILNILGLGVVAYLLYLFPFDFSSLGGEPQLILSVVVRASLVIILLVLAVITLTNLVKFVVRIVTGSAAYGNY